METRRDERISQLIQALKRSDKLHLKEAASLLGVSEMTIRRDLNGHSGPVVLLGGYIVLEPRSATHYLLSDQKTRLVEEKRRAARHAAALLEAHQMAFFDCGTTTPWIIDAIDDALPFTGVCYSLNTFLALQEKPQCRAVLCGGEFHASNAIFMPLSLEDTLSHLSPDIAFYSAAGIDCEQGATCYNLEELPVKHWAAISARMMSWSRWRRRSRFPYCIETSLPAPRRARAGIRRTNCRTSRAVSSARSRSSG